MKKLLKEYIEFIIEQVLTEDIDMSRFSPAMVGVYAFAQAINKLITEGGALAGAVPIDAIDAGQDIKKAPMRTETEGKAGISFQYSGNMFKLYLDPTKTTTSFNASDESHDVVHAFTANIAKAFGRRRESIEKDGKYTITPSRFNKITINEKRKQKIKDAFKKEYNSELSDEAFTKPFEFEYESDYMNWFTNEYGEVIKKHYDNDDVVARPIARLIAKHLYDDIKNLDFNPGYVGQKYWGKWKDTEDTEEKPSFAGYRSNTSSPKPFGLKKNETYKQPSEDEEELGNKMSEIIGNYVTEGEPLPNPKTIVKMLMNDYRKSTGLTNMPPKDFTHRFDTPEVRNALIRLFELYNQLLPRYMIAARQAQPEERRAMYQTKSDKQVSKKELAAARKRLNK